MNDYFDVNYLETAESTNSLLKNGNYSDRTVLYTFNQTLGRGRDQKKWIDFPGKNIALSLLLKPIVIIKNPHWYVVLLSLSFVQLIKAVGVSTAWIKWPNDIYVGDSKLAGILAESIWNNNNTEKIVAGIGINVNSSRKDLSMLDNSAISLSVLSGRKFDLHGLVRDFCSILYSNLKLLENDSGLSILKKQWLKECLIINKKVVWTLNGIKKSGKISSIDNEGYIYLEYEGQNIRIVSGDVKVEVSSG